MNGINYSPHGDKVVRGFQKSKEGARMAISSAVIAKTDELRQAARILGENLSKRTFGERGPGLSVSLTDLEQILRPLVEEMAGGFLATSAAEQSKRLSETLPCPTCGRECVQKTRERRMVAEHGPFSWAEPVCHCAHCERSFFPSTNRLEG
jgi:hypothetical protein